MSSVSWCYVSLPIHAGQTFSTEQWDDTILADHFISVDSFLNETQDIGMNGHHGMCILVTNQCRAWGQPFPSADSSALGYCSSSLPSYRDCWSLTLMNPKPASIPSAGGSLGNHWESVAHSTFFLSGSAMPRELPLGPCTSALSHGIVSAMNFLFDFCLFLSYWHHNSALKTRKFRIWFGWFCELTLLTLILFIPNWFNTQLSFLHF